MASKKKTVSKKVVKRTRTSKSTVTKKSASKRTVDLAGTASKQRKAKTKSVLQTWKPRSTVNGFMVQTARFAGVALVVLGGAFTMYYSQYVWSDTLSDLPKMTAAVCDGTTDMSTDPACTSSTATASSSSSSSVSSSSSSSTTTSTSTSTSSSSQATDSQSSTSGDTSTIVEDPPATFSLDKSEPLSGIVRVSITVDAADSVNVLVFQGSYTDPIQLGPATLKSGTNVWVFDWDTTTVSDGNYRIAADIYNAYNQTNPYRSSDATYKQVQNQKQTSDQSGTMQQNDSQQTDQSTTAQEEVDKEPKATIELESEDPVSGNADFRVSVQNADKVEIIALHIASDTSKTLGSASKKKNDTWFFTWQTKKFVDGEYQVMARITNQYGTYRSNVINLTVQNEGLGEEQDSLSDEEKMESEPESEPPEPRLIIEGNDTLSGTVQVLIEISDTQFVEIYSEREGSKTKSLLGLAQDEGDGRWTFLLNTRNMPNGRYTIYPQVKNSFGVYRGPGEKVEIYNKPASSVESEEYKEIAEAVDKAEKETKKSSESDNRTAKDPEDKIIARFNKAIDKELARFAAAYRSGDEDRLQRAYKRIDRLKKQIANEVRTETDSDDLIEKINEKIDKIVEQYRESIEEVDKIIAERAGRDVLKDTDKDGITDYDEITIFKTDPLVADTDGDGFPDGAEIESGYNPTDPRREVAIRYESPREKGVVRSDIFKVESIVPVVEDGPIRDTDGVPAQAVITGKGLPNSYVTVYIFSSPVVVSVKTDEDGSWRYRFDKEIEDGEHSVYVGVTDNAGRIVAKSEPFIFVKEAQAFTPVDRNVPVVTETVGESDSLLSQYMIYLIISISVVSIGLVLILLGLHLDARRKKFAEVLREDDLV